MTSHRASRRKGGKSVCKRIPTEWGPESVQKNPHRDRKSVTLERILRSFWAGFPGHF
jgi:hypothetical protein